MLFVTKNGKNNAKDSEQMHDAIAFGFLERKKEKIYFFSDCLPKIYINS